MYILELQASFKVVSSILNSRPIYARWGNRGADDPDFLSPLTLNMLLTNRANVEIPVRNYSSSDKPLLRLQYVEETVSQWWHQFACQNFSRNMACGDVVLIQYEGKYKPATYRLGVVVLVETDEDGLVRTVVVEYSLLSELPFSMRSAYKGITKKRIKVSVQRLVLILPVEERFGCDGQADPAALDEGGHVPVQDPGKEDVVGSKNTYAVVWDSVVSRYVHQAGALAAGEHDEVAVFTAGQGGVTVGSGHSGGLGGVSIAACDQVVVHQQKGVKL